MAMERLSDFTERATPYHRSICDSCGKELGSHWQFRHEKMADVGQGPNGRKPDGKLYCHPDQTTWMRTYHQRELRRTLHKDYEREIVNAQR